MAKFQFPDPSQIFKALAGELPNGNWQFESFGNASITNENKKQFSVVIDGVVPKHFFVKTNLKNMRNVKKAFPKISNTK